MILKKVYTVENNQLIIHLPDGFKGKQQLMVTVEDSIDTQVEKLNLLKKAATDSLFLSDIIEVTEDFKITDRE